MLPVVQHDQVSHVHVSDWTERDDLSDVLPDSGGESGGVGCVGGGRREEGEGRTGRQDEGAWLVRAVREYSGRGGPEQRSEGRVEGEGAAVPVGQRERGSPGRRGASSRPVHRSGCHDGRGGRRSFGAPSSKDVLLSLLGRLRPGEVADCEFRFEIPSRGSEPVSDPPHTPHGIGPGQVQIFGEDPAGPGRIQAVRSVERS
mmetsp:Transcript_60371/g.178780  ORF Transcript_60371/g.178780 Transcript_60371/m.178780 type:complete len:201 (+) Transcript_60371:1212-1814(+)